MSREFWENNAENWTQAIRSQMIESRKVTHPAIIQEILRWNPKSVLDLGCGEGWIASQLLPKSIQYVGLDFSQALIESAKKHHTGARFEAIGYNEISQGRWQSNERFDLAVFNFSLFEEDLDSLFRETLRHLKPEGTLLIQTLHPCFTIQPYEDGWRTEDFKTFPLPFEGSIRWYARTLSSWVELFSNNGLKVKALTEPLHPTNGAPLSLIFALEA